MTDYSLISALHNDPKPIEPETPSGINYTILEVVTYDAGVLTVHVPTAEVSNFKSAILEHTVLVRADLRTELRNHRGILGK